MPCIQFFSLFFRHYENYWHNGFFFLSSLSLSIGCWLFFSLHLCTFLLSSSSKKCSVRCFVIIICLTWSRFFSSYHWLYLQVCMCKCAWKTKEFPLSNAARRETERFVAFWHGLRIHTKSVLSGKHWTFKCFFAPFGWKVVEQIFVLFSSALILANFDIWISSWSIFLTLKLRQKKTVSH